MSRQCAVYASYETINTDAFDVFPPACLGSFEETYQRRRRLPVDQRENFDGLDVELTLDFRERQIPPNYKVQMHSGRNGILGSRGRRAPIYFDDVQTMVRQGDSELSPMWKENNLRGRIKNEGSPKEDCIPGEDAAIALTPESC